MREKIMGLICQAESFKGMPIDIADQILALITERIKKIENPHTKHRAYPGNISESLSHDGFEECRQAILKEIEK